jgi:hypothetical protein
MASIAAATAFKRTFADPAGARQALSYQQQGDSYRYLWHWYANSIYEDMGKWQTYKADYRLYRYIRSMYNPCRRLVDFYAGAVYPGNLRAPGQQLPDGFREAIPLGEDTAPELADAIAQYWQWANWQSGKSLFVRYGACLGDVLVEVSDDVKRGKVGTDVRWPGFVSDLDLDSQGNVKGYALQYDAEDEADNGKLYTFKKTVDLEAFRYFKDDEPFDYGKGAAYPNTWGFVPAVWVKHTDLGGDHGAPAMRNLGKWDTLNESASMVHDYIRKIVKAPIILVGGSTMSAVTAEAKQGSTRGPVDPLGPSFADEQISLLRGPDGANVLTIPLNIAEAYGEIDRQMKEVEADHPELTMYSQLRTMTQVTGPAASRLMGDVSLLVGEAQAQYDQASTKLFQMATAIAGERIKRGDWAGPLTRQQLRFAPFDLSSYAAGDLDFSISPRPIIPIIESENLATQTAAIAALVGAGSSLYAAAKAAGLSEEEAQALNQGDVPVPGLVQ